MIFKNAITKFKETSDKDLVLTRYLVENPLFGSFLDHLDSKG